MKINNVTVPDSVLVKKQVKTYGPRLIHYCGESAFITAKVRFDDECNNGHNTFSITGEIISQKWRGDRFMAGGCIHEEIAKHFPELAPFIKWHLVSTDAPMHYAANVVYHAGDRDCWGQRKGEARQIISGLTGLPCWTLEAVNAPGVKISQTPTGDEYKGKPTVPLFILDHDAQAKEGDLLPPVPVLRWVPLCREGEGKARDFNAARSCAVWPEATEAELSQEPEALRAQLMARLPALMENFKRDVESLGFTY